MIESNVDIWKTDFQRALVTDFLKKFKELSSGNPRIAAREEYLATLAILGLQHKHAQQFILKLEPENYCEGLGKSTKLEDEEIMIFGVDVEEDEVYIKLQIREEKGVALVISFHIAKYKMNYPLKTQNKNV